MYKLWTSTQKEIRLLLRDWGGLAILFVMPSVLLITITVIQESTFKAVGDSSFPVIWVDEDEGEVSQLIRHSAAENPSISLVTSYQNQQIDRHLAEKLVSEGRFQIALIVPEGLSEGLSQKVGKNVEMIMEQFSLDPGQVATPRSEKVSPNIDNIEISIFFDPAAGQSFRNSIKNSIEKMLANVETKKIYEHFQEQMGLESVPAFLEEEAISFKEIIAQKGNDGIIPNAVQHNVPAWILFGIFFIVVPLGINMVKEKNIGTYVRLRTSPVSYVTIMGGKILTYGLICLIQFFLMLLIARYVFPMVGLIPFRPGSQLDLMIIIAAVSGLAAIGLGLLIGTLAQTQEQSAPFGAILVIILAALGGVWVPTFVMPLFMQKVAAFSPMNWGLSAFYDVILRNGTLADIVLYVIYLILFFVITTGFAVLFDRYKRAT